MIEHWLWVFFFSFVILPALGKLFFGTSEQRAVDRAYEAKLKDEARAARNAARKLKDPKELGWFDLLDPR